jgi:hypothetical protein
MAVTLATVETAITAVQTLGQTTSVDGISYSRANLAALIDLRDRLQMSESRSSGQRPVFRGMDFNTQGYD